MANARNGLESLDDSGEIDDRALHRVKVRRGDAEPAEGDWLAAEVPLEIRLDGEPFAVTMRTPGDDRELVAGFLFTEGVLRGLGDLECVEPCRDPLAFDPDNRIDVTLSPAGRERKGAIAQARRELLAVSACGLCGKAHLESVYQRLPELEPMSIPSTLARALPARMAERQSLFAKTGGAHGAALFDAEGELLDCREDVGRHNAVDKLVGASLLRGELEAQDGGWRGKILVVSARAGFEIVQKAIMASVPVLVAVGAASSLAAETARRSGLELHTFVHPHRSNLLL